MGKVHEAFGSVISVTATRAGKAAVSMLTGLGDR